MDLELHLLVWKELREHFTGSELQDAAEDFVRILIEHGADAEKISEYSIDTEIKEALKDYIEFEDDDIDEFDEDEDEYNYS